MRTPFLKISMIAVLVASACACALTADALAETGGSASAPTPAPTVRKAALATWFGPGFYGQTTACGQTLTPAVVGVANRTLPCGTLVKFTYKGHAATVPVIDRGPYAHNGAQWDLTSGAAIALGMNDTARLNTRVVGNVPNTPTLGLPPGAAAEAEAVASTGGAAAIVPAG
ncbi:MAG TPA: septal ring lytic transglycosylase RlpA family protein [Solirubrobacteraceae bacterium]|jgi:rare lipoprotein A (peptidoglycan hydrolase)|nr:septal ring lytic transglycosylase RlpA family protein [Solirubrobacteraceae bacterium]